MLLHPLRNYPGPFIAKFTDVYAGYYAVRKNLHLATYFDHLKYGMYAHSKPLVLARENALEFVNLTSVKQARYTDQLPTV